MADRSVSLSLKILDEATSPVTHIAAVVDRLTAHLDKLGDAAKDAQSQLSKLHAPKIDLPGGGGGGMEAPVTRRGGGGLGGIMSAIGAVTGPVGKALAIVGRIGSTVTGVASKVVGALGSIASAMANVVSSGLRMAAVVGGTVTAALGYLAIKAATAAADVETQFHKLWTALKSPEAAQSMLDWARKFADVTPFSTGETIEAVARLENYGLSAKQWLPMIGDMAASMGKSVVDGVEAIADAVSGGGLERLKEFGISTRMLLEAGAEKGAGGISYMGESALEALKAALASIMSSRFAGAMDRMATTLAGKWSTFVGALQNLAATIGTALMPVLKPALDYMTRFVDALRERLGPVLERLQPVLVAFAERALAALPIMLERIPQLLWNIAESLPTIIPKIQEFGTKALAIFDWLFGMINQVGGAALSGILDTLIDTLFGAANGVIWFATQLQTEGSAINTFLTNLVTGIQNAVATIGGSMQWLMQQLSDPSSRLSEILLSVQTSLAQIGQALTTLAPSIQKALDNIFSEENIERMTRFADNIIKITDMLLKLQGPAFNKFTSILEHPIEAIPGPIGWWATGTRRLVEAARGAGQKYLGIGGPPPSEQRSPGMDLTVRVQSDSAEHSATVQRDARRQQSRLGVIPQY